jgi:hypothetical protein
MLETPTIFHPLVIESIISPGKVPLRPKDAVVVAFPLLEVREPPPRTGA